MREQIVHGAGDVVRRKYERGFVAPRRCGIAAAEHDGRDVVEQPQQVRREGQRPLELLPIRENVDEVIYVPGAVLWRVDRAHYSRSGMNKIVGTRLYKAMTIRNCNTVRKLVDLMTSGT